MKFYSSHTTVLGEERGEGKTNAHQLVWKRTIKRVKPCIPATLELNENKIEYFYTLCSLTKPITANADESSFDHYIPPTSTR